MGVIANPSAGKDIRRLVAHGRVVSNQKKVSLPRRVLVALDAVGVERVAIMPDPVRLGLRALDGLRLRLVAELLEMPVLANEDDSTVAAGMMAQMGVTCLVTLGGDGTNRAVAKGCGGVPLVPISTGTNAPTTCSPPWWKAPPPDWPPGSSVAGWLTPSGSVRTANVWKW